MSGWVIDEASRDAALAEFDLDALQASGRLDRIAAFAARLCGAPIALVSLVERDRQFFLARTGLAVSETPRATSFCQYAMQMSDVMVVPDATLDPRFATNPLVTGDPYIRFYAGAPLVADDGVPLGSLCVIDRIPRKGLSDLQYQGLQVLAEAVVAAFRAHRTLI
ncbi:MAG: GAF domain-containing protein [Sphingomonas sp.]|nr:GAF domain-containing protein [Sphingomonas sp.]